LACVWAGVVKSFFLQLDGTPLCAGVLRWQSHLQKMRLVNGLQCWLTPLCVSLECLLRFSILLSPTCEIAGVCLQQATRSVEVKSRLCQEDVRCALLFLCTGYVFVVMSRVVLLRSCIPRFDRSGEEGRARVTIRSCCGA
jgi:hypothetical protein